MTLDGIQIWFCTHHTELCGAKCCISFIATRLPLSEFLSFPCAHVQPATQQTLCLWKKIQKSLNQTSLSSLWQNSLVHKWQKLRKSASFLLYQDTKIAVAWCLWANLMFKLNRYIVQPLFEPEEKALSVTALMVVTWLWTPKSNLLFVSSHLRLKNSTDLGGIWNCDITKGKGA